MYVKYKLNGANVDDILTAFKHEDDNAVRREVISMLSAGTLVMSYKTSKFIHAGLA